MDYKVLDDFEKLSDVSPETIKIMRINCLPSGSSFGKNMDTVRS